MKRIVLIAGLVVALIAPQAFAAPSPWLKSVASAQKKAKEGNQFIFVDLFADWCGWCHRFEQEVFPSEAFQKATDDMVLLRLNTEDGVEGTKFAQRYQVTSLPTFLLLNSDLTVAGIIRGYAPAAQFVQTLQATVTKYNDFQKTVKNESNFAKDYTKRLEIAREFLTRQSYPQSETRFKKLLADGGVPAAVRDESYYQLAMVYIVQAKYADARKTIADFDKVQTQGEFLERARLLRSDMYLQQGNLAGAAEELRSFKEKFPNSPFIPNIDNLLPSIERRLSPPKTK